MPQAASASGWAAVARRRGPLACLLWPLSLLYRALLALRRLAFAIGWLRAQRLPVPVLVVGNVVVGGAGKTPTAIALLNHLRERGWRVGLISRGYGRRGDGVLEVQATTDPARCGDEPLLIHRRTGVPVWVGRRRAEAGLALLAAHPDTELIVCDDGLQHWALRSDLRIAVFDDRGLGNGWLLPAGLLREPWPLPAQSPHMPQLMLAPRDSAIPLSAGTARFAVARRLASMAVDAHGQTRPLAEAAVAPVLALAAIAQPEAFFTLLRTAGVAVQRHVALPDHADADMLGRSIADWTGTVLCTEKDLVKLGRLPEGCHAWAVPLVLDIEPGFFAAVDDHLARQRALAH